MSAVFAGAPWLGAMARIFDQNGEALYLVGGAVRNPLMGLPLSDIDVCGPATPKRVCDVCRGTEVTAHLRAAHFGTVELFVTDAQGKRHMAEYTTWREDSYRLGHRPESVRFTTDIAVDAQRRDFSVNALYRRVHADGLEAVIDPTGGLAHLADGVLHTVSENPDRVLGEDGLRILRAARFQAELGLAPTAALVRSLAQNAPLLRDIACERLRDEWQKTLMADLRYPMLARKAPATLSGLAALRDCGAWQILFGDLPYDAQAAAALQAFPETLAARMALLFHRCAPEAVESAMLRLRCSVREAAQTAAILRALHGFGGPVFPLAQLGREAVETAHRASLALGDASRAGESLAQLRGKPMSLKELAVNGDDVKPLLLQSGLPMRDMGRALNALWQAVAEGRAANEREALLPLAQSLFNGAKL